MSTVSMFGLLIATSIITSLVSATKKEQETSDLNQLYQETQASVETNENEMKNLKDILANFGGIGDGRSLMEDMVEVEIDVDGVVAAYDDDTDGMDVRRLSSARSHGAASGGSGRGRSQSIASGRIAQTLPVDINSELPTETAAYYIQAYVKEGSHQTSWSDQPAKVIFYKGFRPCNKNRDPRTWGIWYVIGGKNYQITNLKFISTYEINAEQSKEQKYEMIGRDEVKRHWDVKLDHVYGGKIKNAETILYLQLDIRGKRGRYYPLIAAALDTLGYERK